MQFSDTYKARVVRRLTGRHAPSPSVLADELDLPVAFIEGWFRDALRRAADGESPVPIALADPSSPD